MDLTDEERGWALSIKKAMMDADPAFAQSISDFEYAQHAIVAKEKISKALRRIRRLRDFKQEHGISRENETLEAGLELIQRFEQLAPGFFMAFGQDEKGGSITTWHYSSFFPKNFEKAQDWRNCFAAFYYLMEAMQPDIAAVRQGVVFLADCKGIGWRNFSLEMEKHAAKLYQDAYPVRIKQMDMVNSPVLMKAMYTLCKPFLSKKLKEIIRIDEKSEDLHTHLARDVLPATFGGTQTSMDMNKNIEELLRKRFENKAKFKL